MVLDGRVLHEFRQALLGAFPTPSGVEELFKFQLNKNLQEIASVNQGLEGLWSQVFEWANPEGRMHELLAAARQERPEHDALLKFDAQWGELLRRGDALPTASSEGLFRALDRERQRAMIKELAVAPPTLRVVAISGAPGAGHKHLTELLAEAMQKSRLVHLSWPDEEEPPGAANHLRWVLEAALLKLVGAKLPQEILPPATDPTPFDGPASAGWTDYFTQWQTDLKDLLDAPVVVRHEVGTLPDADLPVLGLYLQQWCSLGGLRQGARLDLVFECVGRRSEAWSQRVGDLARRHGADVVLLPPLQPVSGEDVARWLSAWREEKPLPSPEKVPSRLKQEGDAAAAVNLQRYEDILLDYESRFRELSTGRSLKVRRDA
ncbi:MAG: hypothetical protein HY909_26140 [Deltaproteobacteria bacterium]|nr:hypothetical protein [Deltaproteobacteria bacterium]